MKHDWYYNPTGTNPSHPERLEKRSQAEISREIEREARLRKEHQALLEREKQKQNKTNAS